MFPAIDHSIISPSGKVSKRAREAALKREYERLFSPGFGEAAVKSEEDITKENKERLLRSAANLRELAARGMKTRAYIKAAEKLEMEAANL